MNVLKSLVAAVFVFPITVMACSSNTDCSPGSGCVRASGSIYGDCEGGISRGNSNDSRPTYPPFDMTRTYGNTCSFNIDCRSGTICVKQGGIKGVCKRSR